MVNRKQAIISGLQNLQVRTNPSPSKDGGSGVRVFQHADLIPSMTGFNSYIFE